MKLTKKKGGKYNEPFLIFIMQNNRKINTKQLLHRFETSNIYNHISLSLSLVFSNNGKNHAFDFAPTPTFKLTMRDRILSTKALKTAGNQF